MIIKIIIYIYINLINNVNNFIMLNSNKNILILSITYKIKYNNKKYHLLIFHEE